MNKTSRHNLNAACVVSAFVLAAQFVAASAHAQMGAPPDPLSFDAPDPTVKFKDISIEQKLDAQIPLNLMFQDETGQDVLIGEYLGDKPAILALVYYECPMLCTQILNGLEITLKGMKYGVGKDFSVITVTIDPGETYELAAKKKAGHIEHLNREGAEDGWHFLTGSSESIETLASIVGYRYAYDPLTDQYAHAAGIMLLTPTGKIARYHMGIEYIARDVEYGLIEASEGKIGTLVDKLVLLCYAYDPERGQYGLSIIRTMRVLAVLTMMGIASFWVTPLLRRKLKVGREPTTEKQERIADTHSADH